MGRGVVYPSGSIPIAEVPAVAKTEVSSIGKYQILERVATGDAAEIFKARLDGIAGFRRLFAIKRVRPNLARNASYAQMIEEEARIAGMLNHGNIVQLLDLGRDGGALYLVMEFVDGWSLNQILELARSASTPLSTGPRNTPLSTPTR